MTTPTPRSGLWQWLGPSLGLLAGLAYLLTLSSGAFPGESVSLIAQSAGLVPRLTTANPLWHLFAWVLAHIPIGTIAARLNLFSAVCGGAVVWLLYHIVSGTIYDMIEDTSTDRPIAATAARAAGTCAALFLAFCIPFWYVSNRAHTASFDILLLLVVTSLFAGYVRDLSERKILLISLLCGLGTVEFATFIVLEPILFICLLAVLWAKKQLKVSLLLKIAVCFAAGLLLYLVSAFQFYLSDGRDLLQSKSVFEVVWTTWRMQYFLIAHSVPKQGWILVGLMGIIPWLACLLVARRGLNGENEWGMYILHAAMTAVAFASLFNIKIAPWRFLGTRTVMVTPYLLMAMVYGYLVAYWYLLLKTLPLAEENPGQPARRKWFGIMILAPAIGAVCIAPFINFSEADARPAKAINQYSRSIIECMDQRTWLVSDGQIQNSMLLLAADDLRKHVIVLDASLSNADPYMRYVARFFTTPRLKSLTEVGMTPLLLEWFAGDREIEDKVAVFSMPEQWLSAGLMSFPDRTVFLGTRDMSKIDVDELLRKNRKFWDDTVPVLRRAEKVGCPIVPGVAANLLRHTSLMANDLGVALADLGRTNDAFMAYAKAREIHPGNVSALLNQYTMLKEGYKTDLAGEVEKNVSKLMEANKTSPISYSLSVLYFGSIRAPQALVNSTRPAKAVAGTKKAIDLGAVKSDRRKESMALFYLMHSQEDDNEALYREQAAKNMKDGDPLLALSRISAKKGDYKEAAALIEQAEKRGVSKAQSGFARAEVCLISGDIDKARTVLEDLANTNPNLPHAWALLATVLLRQGDTTSAELDRCVKRLSDMKRNDFFATVVLGQIAMARNDAATAQKQFDLALTIKPTAIPVMELLLRLDLASGQHDATTEHIRRILSLDPGHAFANYILGSIQTERQEYELAENSLRRSLGTEKSAPALNDLAWLLTRRGEYGEAEKMARDAIEMNDKLYQAYDTLGVIMMKSKRLDEAEKAFSKALSIYDGNPDIQMNMAELQAAKGNKTQALKIIGTLSEKRTQFSEENQQRLDGLARQFRSM